MGSRFIDPDLVKWLAALFFDLPLVVCPHQKQLRIGLSTGCPELGFVERQPEIHPLVQILERPPHQLLGMRSRRGDVETASLRRSLEPAGKAGSDPGSLPAGARNQGSDAPMRVLHEAALRRVAGLEQPALSFLPGPWIARGGLLSEIRQQEVSPLHVMPWALPWPCRPQP